MKRTIGEDMAAPAGADAAAGVVPETARRPLRELMNGRLLDALLERSRDQPVGLRPTGEGSMLGELVRAVLERAALTSRHSMEAISTPVVLPAGQARSSGWDSYEIFTINIVR